jgi:transmembrane sensor
MADWLARAHAANAALGDIVPGTTDGDALRARIGARLGRRKLLRRAALGGAGLALAGALLVLSTAPRTRLELPSTTAPALTLPAPPNVPLAEPSDGSRLADGSRAIALDAATVLVIDRDDASETHVTLSTGAARFEVEPRAGKPFVVHAGEVSVHVVGTRFVVTRSSEGRVEVSVEHGEVDVVSTSTRVHLRAGERRVFETATAATEKVASVAPKREPKPDAAGELLATADLARREGRVDAAVMALETLLARHASDPRAASAAFSLGRVLLEARHEPEAAAAAFARVATLEPGGPLVEDALAREIEAWARAGALPRAQSLARVYLRRYPDGARAALVRSYAKLD